MIAIKMPKPRAGPAASQRQAVALGLALAVALKRVGNFEVAEALAWRGIPDVAHTSGEKVDIELDRCVDIGIADSIARMFARRRWDGITVALNGELGKVKLGIDIDIYANERVPVKAGITSEGVGILAEPRGYVGDEVVESFYELFNVERENMKALVEELVAEMRCAALWKAVAGVYALRGFSFEPEDAIPLWRRLGHVAKDLYKLLPPGLAELPKKVFRDAVPELLKLLEKYYTVKLYIDAVQMIPLSTKSHRDATALLRDVLAEAAKKTAGGAGFVEAVKEELRRRP